MSRAAFATFVGVINAILSSLVLVVSALAVFTVIGLVEEEDVKTETDTGTVKESAESAESTEKEDDFLSFFAVLAVGFVVFYLYLFIVSVLLVVGVRKQRHQYMAPWVYTAVISLILNIYEVAENLKSKDNDFIWYALSAVFEAAIWYPIYKHYYELKHPRVIQPIAVPVATPVAATYVPTVQSCPPPAEFSHATAKYVPTTVTAAAPQQPQFAYPSVPAPTYYSYKV